MTASEYLQKYDSLPADATDKQREDFLSSACLECDLRKENDVAGRSALYNELGGFYRARGRYAEGEDAFRAALSILDTGGENITGSTNYATTLNNLAGLYRLNDRLDEALDMFGRAEKIYDSDPGVPPDIRASCKNNTGLVYLDKCEWDRAEDLFNRALAILPRDRKFDSVRATTLINLSFAYFRSGDKKTALDSVREAARLASQPWCGDERTRRNCSELERLIQESPA